jgi:hypothetical protein
MGNVPEKDVSPRVQECLAHATKCRIRAAAVADPHIRFTFEIAANQWRIIAKQIEQLEAERRNPGRWLPHSVYLREHDDPEAKR